MSTEYEDEQMIHEGDTPEELEHSEDEAAEHARLADEKAKKDKKLRVMLFGGLAVVAVVFLGFRALFPTAKPVAPSSMMSNDRPSMATNALPPAAMPAPQAPVSIPPASAPVAPSAALPAPVGMPAPAAVPGADSLVAMGSNAPAPGVHAAPALPAAMAVPGVADPLKPAEPMPAVAPAAVVATSADPKAVEGFSRGMDELTKKLDELKAMFTKFDDLQIGDRLAKLEARVGALEGHQGGKIAAAGSSDSPTAPVRHHARAPAVQAAKVVPIGEGEDMLFSRMADGGRQGVGIPVVSNVGSNHPAAQPEVARSYVLHAVIPGRIWVKNADGNSQTFESGEVLPDGAKILKIDPDRGDVVTSKGVLRFDAR